MDPIEKLLSYEPYELNAVQKAPLFLGAMKSAFRWHAESNPFFAERVSGFDIDASKRVEDFPFLPVDDFKGQLQTSVSDDQVVRIVESSGTSGNPSQVALDDITIARQQRALSTIFANYIGSERKHFIVFDNKKSVTADGKRTSSRASGLRGMTLFAKSMQFVLDAQLQIDEKAFSRALKKIPDGAEICIWGFTWMLHAASARLPEHQDLLAVFHEKMKSAASIHVLHVGGWKKLENQKVSKEQFSADVAGAFGIGEQSMMDVYGMTEHLGTVYLDDEHGHKSVSTYSDVIIRDPETLEPLGIGEVGRIQLLTPVPHSYPGVSILTTDLGRIEGIDDCSTGRPGKYFTFQGRYSGDSS